MAIKSELQLQIYQKPQPAFFELHLYHKLFPDLEDHGHAVLPAVSHNTTIFN